MKRIKRPLLLMILLIVMTSVVLGACGQSSAPAASVTEKEKAPSQPAQQSAGETRTETAAPAEKTEDKPEEKPEEPPKPSYVVEGQVLAEGEGFRISFDKVEESWLGSIKFALLCENLTEDKTLMFSISDTAVNGCMVSSLFADEVAPGKKSFEELSLSGTSLEDFGITSCDKLELSLRVYDSENWSAPSLIDERMTVYPTGLAEDEVVIPERPKRDGELVAEDGESFCFVILESGKTLLGGFELKCYIENRSDKTMMFSWDDVSVNGFMCDPFWARTVSPGCRLISDISFSSNRLEENRIENIEEIEFTLEAYDQDNWLAKDRYSKVFTLSFGQ